MKLVLNVYKLISLKYANYLSYSRFSLRSKDSHINYDFIHFGSAKIGTKKKQFYLEESEGRGGNKC